MSIESRLPRFSLGLGTDMNTQAIINSFGVTRGLHENMADLTDKQIVELWGKTTLKDLKAHLVGLKVQDYNLMQKAKTCLRLGIVRTVGGMTRNDIERAHVHSQRAVFHALCGEPTEWMDAASVLKAATLKELLIGLQSNDRNGEYVDPPDEWAPWVLVVVLEHALEIQRGAA